MFQASFLEPEPVRYDWRRFVVERWVTDFFTEREWHICLCFRVLRTKIDDIQKIEVYNLIETCTKPVVYDHTGLCCLSTVWGSSLFRVLGTTQTKRPHTLLPAHEHGLIKIGPGKKIYVVRDKFKSYEDPKAQWLVLREVLVCCQARRPMTLSSYLQSEVQ